MKERVYEVKDLEEAKKLAINDFGLPLEDLSFDVVEERKGFLGIGSNISVHVCVYVDPIQKAKDYIETFLEEAGFGGQVEKRVRGNIVEFNIYTRDANGVLIGKNAKTLAALQYMASIIVNQYFDREYETGLIVKVDVGDYRKKRESRLESLAVRVAREVAKTKIPAKLDYMNSYERKIIHNKISDWNDVTTHSEGEEPRRYIVIEPRKKK
ncbi:MAG: RNA-binding cell elongation regulator Jag/EloR [Bacilli bacterium]|nr:single-stranded DNA-binding protein [Acholeplasmataceae bacterium]